MEPADRPTFAQVNDELQILPAIVRQLLKQKEDAQAARGARPHPPRPQVCSLCRSSGETTAGWVFFFLRPFSSPIVRLDFRGR